MAIEAEALRDALRLALKFVDRSAGEGIFFEADGDTPAMDAADVCIAVSEALGIDFAGPEYSAFVDGGPLPDLIHRSALAEDTARAAEGTRAKLAQTKAQAARKAPTWDEAVTLARRAIYDTDGRGMIARNRNHLQERVAREIFNATRALDKEAADANR